jgi:predicted nucleic acid-binding protein
MLVADTNVLIELFLPSENSAEVQQWRAADKDWQLPALWVFEFRHILLKYLRAERLDLDKAIANLVEAERLVPSQDTNCFQCRFLAAGPPPRLLQLRRRIRAAGETAGLPAADV